MLNEQFRPLLSPIDDPLKNPNFFKNLPFPLLGSAKFDGVRCITRLSLVDIASNAVVAVSRTNKLLPSRQVQEDFTHVVGTDGELIVGPSTAFNVYNLTQGHVMSKNKPADMKYHVFDFIGDGWHTRPYYQRLEEAEKRIQGLDDYLYVRHRHLETLEDLLMFEQECLEAGYEGIMLRTPEGRYKNGRATYNDRIIYKLKRFSDDEGVVVDFIERQINNNAQETDERGYAKRSSSKAGKVAAGTLGKFIVHWKGQDIEVAPGVFKHTELQEIWDNRSKYEGQLLKFRYFEHGIKELPRFPRALGWRNKIDL